MARILVVDDEPDVRMLVVTILETEGFDTGEAANGVEAVERLTSGEPWDAVILDVMMPVLDGWGVLERLADRRSEVPPVLVLSAHCSPTEKARALQLGAVAFCDKPFDPDELVEFLKEVTA